MERFGSLVDQQWNWRENQALSRRLKNAKLRTPNACVEEIDYRTPRGLDKSVILTSQLPVSRWHEQIGDPTLADGILDRLVHNAHRIEMRGDLMRKSRGKANG